MIKPRCGFYITDKFPKAPQRNEEGFIHIPEGSVVVYDKREFADCPDEEFIRYCEELILYHDLRWDLKEFMDAVQIAAFFFSLPKDRARMKKVLKNNPHVRVEFEDDKGEVDA